MLKLLSLPDGGYNFTSKPYLSLPHPPTFYMVKNRLPPSVVMSHDTVLSSPPIKISYSPDGQFVNISLTSLQDLGFFSLKTKQFNPIWTRKN